MDPNNDFSALLDELAALQAGNTDMAKAMKTEDAEDDEKIAAAADTDGDGKTEGAAEGESEAKGGDKDGDDKDDEYFGKSMSVTLEDGSQVEAFDGTEAIRGLHQRIDALAEKIDGQAGNDMMAKALGGVGDGLKGLQGVVKDQGEMLKALRSEVATLRSSGTGRKATLSVHEKPTAAPAQPDGLTPDQVMTKAMSAAEAGKITAREVATLESYFGRGLKPPADLLARIA